MILSATSYRFRNKYFVLDNTALLYNSSRINYNDQPHTLFFAFSDKVNRYILKFDLDKIPPTHQTPPSVLTLLLKELQKYSQKLSSHINEVVYVDIDDNSNSVLLHQSPSPYSDVEDRLVQVDSSAVECITNVVDFIEYHAASINLSGSEKAKINFRNVFKYITDNKISIPNGMVFFYASPKHNILRLAYVELNNLAGQFKYEAQLYDSNGTLRIVDVENLTDTLEDSYLLKT